VVPLQEKAHGSTEEEPSSEMAASRVRLPSNACESRVRWDGHRPGQHLMQVAHCGEQAPRVCEFPAPPGVLRKGEYQATSFPVALIPWPELGADRPGRLLRIGVDTHHPAAVRLLKPGTGGAPRECRGWHHPDRVEPGVPEVFQQATRLTHVGGEVERAKHALPLAVLKEQELVVHQDTHHGTSRRDGGSVVCVDR
jgi:hypothetical protein